MNADTSDLDHVRARYAEERQKRLRADALRQYHGLDGDFEHLDGDPNAGTLQRAPLVATNDVVIVGGGLAGVVIGGHLRKLGFDDIRIVERGGDFGGVWYWNRYPGLSCDIESHIYIPFLEELGHVPTMRYASGDEIRTQLQAAASMYGLYEQALLQTSVERMEWAESDRRWRVTTDRGDTLRARFVIVALGSFGRPKLPAIPGLDAFEGTLFHTSRWDYDYTGGHQGGDLIGLSDKRVGVVGTGATAIQCIPHLARSSQHLYVFQRTPAAVDQRGNRPTNAEWSRSLRPGWQWKRMHNFAQIIDGERPEQDLVCDGWTATFSMRNGEAEREQERLLGRPLTDEERERFAEQADLRVMSGIRARVDSVVHDEETAEALKPWYKRWCKRPQFHDEYLDVFNRPNVTLVDTAGRGVEWVEGNVVFAGGQRVPLDCLIMATGFDVGTDYLRRGSFEVVGRGGASLNRKWSRGLRTLHGMYTHGFPNLFVAGPTQTGLAANYTYSYYGQARHIAHVLDVLRGQEATVVEVEQEAEESWVAEMANAAGSKRYFEDCTPSYFTNEGDLDDPNVIVNNIYGKGAVTFFDQLERWRAAGRLDGLRIG